MAFSDRVSPFSAPNFDIFSPARRSDPRGIVIGAPLDGGQSYTPWIGLTTAREICLKHADRVGLVEVERLESSEAAKAVALAEVEVLRARLAQLEDEVETHTRWVKQKLDLDKPPKPMGRPPKEGK